MKAGPSDCSAPCRAIVYKRDTYRRTGRGPTGFTMHYTKCHCTRTAVDNRGLCWQHVKMQWIETWRTWEEIMASPR